MTESQPQPQNDPRSGAMDANISYREITYHRVEKEISREKLLELVGPIADAADLNRNDIISISINSGTIEVVSAVGFSDDDSAPCTTFDKVEQLLVVKESRHGLDYLEV